MTDEKKETLPELTNQPLKVSLSQTMATQYLMKPAEFLNTIRDTCFRGKTVPTTEQMAAFLIVANEYDLNPFIREIYAFPAKNGGIVPIIPIDGWTKIANKNPNYDGCEFIDVFDDKGQIVSITARIYRKDRTKPVEFPEYYAECYRDTDPWNQWPTRMLRHKAFIQAARYAFSLSGIFDEDEGERMMDIGYIDVTPHKTVEAAESDIKKLDNGGGTKKSKGKSGAKSKEKAPAEPAKEPEKEPEPEPEKADEPAEKSPEEPPAETDGEQAEIELADPDGWDD